MKRLFQALFPKSLGFLISSRTWRYQLFLGHLINIVYMDSCHFITACSKRIHLIRTKFNICYVFDIISELTFNFVLCCRWDKCTLSIRPVVVLESVNGSKCFTSSRSRLLKESILSFITRPGIYRYSDRCTESLRFAKRVILLGHRFINGDCLSI